MKKGTQHTADFCNLLRQRIFEYESNGVPVGAVQAMLMTPEFSPYRSEGKELISYLDNHEIVKESNFTLMQGDMMNLIQNYCMDGELVPSEINLDEMSPAWKHGMAKQTGILKPIEDRTRFEQAFYEKANTGGGVMASDIDTLGSGRVMRKRKIDIKSDAKKKAARKKSMASRAETKAAKKKAPVKKSKGLGETKYPRRTAPKFKKKK